ncbi:uncharacterized protein LOC124279693 [Haliotis rubra]|uniref:uncharacterized protein LOC124279693 n=1 Tax=Haliotis rubra TaxID=36100 RepID=UPI001EE53C9E|nr:uncharacterized protein LOC124279693 [Haliotis rubra]
MMRNGYGSGGTLGEDTPNRNFIHLESLQMNGVPADGGNENAPLIPPRRWYKRVFSTLFGVYDDDCEAKYNMFGFRRNLNTIAGVFAPVALGQFANNVFLRTGPQEGSALSSFKRDVHSDICIHLGMYGGISRWSD